MLDFIETENFKKVGSRRFDFTDGLNIVCGENWKGKTSLMQALAFALYGTKAVPARVENIPTWGQKNCKVTVGVAGYEIERTLKNCKVHQDGELIASGHAACNNFIEDKVIGADLKGFKMLNWSEQGETGALLTIGATQLQRDVERFSGVEFIDQMIKAVDRDTNDLERDIKIFESAGSEEALEADIQDNEATLQGYVIDKDKLIEQREGVRIAADKLDSKIAEAEIQNEEYDRKVRRVERTEAEVKAAYNDMSGLKARLRDEREELKGLEYDDSVDLDQERKQLKEIERNNSDYLRTEKQLETLKTKLADDLDGKIENDQALADEAERAREADFDQAGRVGTAEKDVETLNDKVIQLQEAVDSGVCPECGQTIGDPESLAEHTAKLAKAKVELSEANELLQQCYEDRTQSQAVLDAANKAYAEGYGSWATKKSEWTDEAISLNDLLAGLEFIEDLEAQQAQFEKISAEAAVYERLERQIKRTERELDAARDEWAKSSARLEGYKTDGPSFKVEEAEIATWKMELKANREKQVELATEIGEYNLLIQECEATLERLNKSLADERKFREKLNKVAQLKGFSDFLRDSRIKFISTVWNQIMGVATGFLIQATNGHITALAKSDKDGFTFCEEGVYTPVAGASGAQKEFIGVAIRLALSQVLKATLDMVILDEPTAGMREENALRLSGALLGRGQVLMITHKESDSMAASNVIQL